MNDSSQSTSDPPPLNDRIPTLAARRKTWLERCGLPTEAEVIAEIRHTLDAIKRGGDSEHRVTLALLGVDLGILRGPAIAGDLTATSTSWGADRSQSLGHLLDFVEMATVCNRSGVMWAAVCSRGTGLGAIDFISKMEAMHDAMEATARPFDVAEFYGRKAAWSRETFGPRQRVAGVVAHLRKELVELQGAIVYGPVDPIREELADICLLAIDLSWRAGGCAAELAPMSGDPIEPAAAAEYIEARLKVADVLANVSEREANRDVWEHAFRAEAAVLWGYAFRALGCDGTAIEEKFAALRDRTWPDWRTVPADQPIEHVRAAVEVQVDASAASPAAVAAEIAGQLTAWSETATAMVIVERLPGGATKTMAVRDLIAQWHERGAEVAKFRAAANKSVAAAEETRKVLDASFGETAACAATRVMDELETLRAELANSRACVTALNAALLETREVLGAKDDALTVEVARELMDGRWKLAAAHAERTEDLDKALATIDALTAEKVEWRADSEGLREERRQVRETLGAAPDETALCAARRMDRQRLTLEKCRDALRLLLVTS